MIENLTIIEFRHLSHLRLHELAGLNIIVGPNNVGKTTVLKAVFQAIGRSGKAGGIVRVAIDYTAKPKGFDGVFAVGTSYTNSPTHVHFHKKTTFRTDRHSIFESMKFLPDINGTSERYMEFDSLQSAPHDIAAVLNYIGNDGLRQLTSAHHASLEGFEHAFFLWHRRKSRYEVTPEVVGELSAEGDNLTARLQTILPHKHNEREGIQSFIDHVLPGTGRLAVAPFGDKVRIVFETPHGKEVPLESMGGGVEQVLILATMMISAPRDIPIFVEEPEVHLHPTAQHALMDEIVKNRGDRQMFITTHSPSIINRKDADAKIYRLDISARSRQPSVVQCTTRGEIRCTLDALGARPSDLLQTNCAIWVEGPTESTLLPFLIGLVDPGILEHKHYEIIYTGGSVLAHLDGDVEEEASASMRDIFRICRTNFGIFDRDGERIRPPSKNHVTRICHILGDDASHVTAAYEFEWYYPEPVACRVWRKFPQNSKIFERADAYDIPFYSFLEKNEILSKSTGDRGKVNFAEKAIAVSAENSLRLSWFEGEVGKDLSDLVNKLVLHIRHANGLSGSSDARS